VTEPRGAVAEYGSLTYRPAGDDPWWHDDAGGPFRVFFHSWGARLYRDLPTLSAARSFCDYLIEPAYEDDWVGPGSPDAIVDTRDGTEHPRW
jgi:hypothetical protein